MTKSKRELGESKKRSRIVRGKTRQENVYLVKCPRCGAERWLKKSDAEKSIQNNAPCLRCSRSINGVLGWKATVSRYGIITAIQASQRYRLNNPSKLETEIILILNKLKLSYEREVLIDTNERYFLIDFVINKPKPLAIEVNGHYVHSLREERDREKVDTLEKHGYRVLIITEADIQNHQAERKILETLFQE